MVKKKCKTVRLNYRELDLFARLMHVWLADTGANPLSLRVAGYSAEQVKQLFDKIQRVEYMP
jgi:hypothetical protein